MPHLDTILAVAFAGLVLSAVPGPSMLYILSRTVGQSRAAGLASALGLGLGGVLLAVATALGLAAVFAQFDWLVPTLRYAGSAYLVWLGVDMIRGARASAQVTLEVERVNNKSFSSIIWQGVLVEMFNPKTVLFFALFLPPFVEAGGARAVDGNLQLQLLTLGILVPLTAIPADIFVAYMGDAMTQAVNHQQAVREYLAWFAGFILIFIAINLQLELF